MNVEHRAGCEFRVAGRTLSGTVLRYGDLSPEWRERFEPGSLSPVPAVPLNLQHDSRMTVLGAGEFVLSDGPRALSIRAELPARSAALALVRRGALNGFSVEFHSRAERREFGVRVIERADLVGIGLVDRPSYPGSTAEVRRMLESRAPSQTIGPGRGGYGNAWARSSIRTDSLAKSCKCLPSESKCRRVKFKPGAFDRTVREVEAGRHDVLAHAGGYRAERVLGDTRSRALILAIAGPESPEIPAGSLLVFLMQRILGTVAGDALSRSVEVAAPVVRPLVNDAKSAFEDDVEEGVRTYSDAWIDSVLIKYADDESADGWEYLSTIDDLAGLTVPDVDPVDDAPVPVDVAPPAVPDVLRFPAWL